MASEEQKRGAVVVVVAIVCVFTLELAAMYKGFNGKVMTLCVGAICALGGASIPTLFGWKK